MATGKQRKGSGLRSGQNNSSQQYNSLGLTREDILSALSETPIRHANGLKDYEITSRMYSETMSRNGNKMSLDMASRRLLMFEQTKTPITIKGKTGVLTSRIVQIGAIRLKAYSISEQETDES